MTPRPDVDEFNHRIIEDQVRAVWEEHDVYRYQAGPGPVFSVDTPPPYVSASHLHVGHAMSYSQPDFIVRYRRMCGERVFYPIGFDDNGLPTERYVERLYNIRSTEMGRAEFVALCIEETKRTAMRYEKLWRRVGLSVDWSLCYSTIAPESQRTAQASFIKLYDAGLLRRANDPILWCPECRTSLAQADVEDLQRTGKMYRIRFAASADGLPLPVATTRPELLAACVALYFHPDDERYLDLAGTTARVPLFDYEVPIRTDETVSREFGTGLMMVCTFGDGEDVVKWRRDALALRLVLGPDGRLGEQAGSLAGVHIEQARKAVVGRLAEAGILLDTTSTTQVVGVHERCSTPVEFQIRPQWFIGICANRERFRARAMELEWNPPFMRRRLEDWIDGLRWDWNITRQRHFGAPFPAWFCENCEHPVLADLAALPVDPLTDGPPVSRCPACGHGDLTGDPDVMDTWMTSSLTPQINSGWARNGFRSESQLAPMSLRVQAFEIIRTWLFYTIVQSELHFNSLPWRAVMISGWGLNEQGKKIAKRDLEQSSTESGFSRYDPDHVIDRYGADALRLWATKARIGTDLRYTEKDIRAGRKFVVKMWNVGRFIGMNLADFDPTAARPGAAERTPVDRWLLTHLAATVRDVTAAMEAHDFMQAHLTTARFFWSIYCDRYLEMIKDRFLVPDEHRDADRLSARCTLWESYRSLLGLFAPFAPFITEHMYQRFYRAHEPAVSLHLTAWPVAEPAWETDVRAVDDMSTILDAVRALRSSHRLGAGRRMARLVVDARTPEAGMLVEQIAEPLRVAARADEISSGNADHESAVPGIYIDVVP
jgi:valyl-tRNA synthetase